MNIAITLDDNARDVLIVLISIVGAGLFAVAAGWLGGRQQGRLERIKWRRELYARLLRDVEVMAGGRTGIAPAALPEERVSAATAALTIVFEIAMIQPSMEHVAGELWEQAKNVMYPAAMNWTPAQASSSYLDAWMAFREAAKRDLR